MKYLKRFNESDEYINKLIDESEWNSKKSERIIISKQDTEYIKSAISKLFPNSRISITPNEKSPLSVNLLNFKISSDSSKVFNIEIFETEDEWFYLKYYWSDPLHKTQVEDFWKCDSRDGLFHEFQQMI